MADVEFDYLQPGFDASSLTIPKLRSILVAHDVQYPSTAKKPTLVGLFNNQVAPKARRLLSQHARTKRSTRGIEDAGSVTSHSTVSDNEEDEAVARQTVEPTPRRSSRRSSRFDSEEPTPSAPPSARASVARSSRQSSVRKTATPEVEDMEPPSTAKPARRSRKSAVAPVIKEEEEEEEVDAEEDAELYEGATSPFSSDNPFQSGSSPLGFGQSVTKDRKRRTIDPAELRPKTKATPARRKTDDVSRLKNSVAKLEDFDSVEAGEEFTPEEQEALDSEQLAAGGADLLPVRRKKAPRSSSKGALLAAPLAILLAVAAAVGFLWRQEKLDVGYCGVGRAPSPWLGGYEVPEQLAFIQPQCEPCPAHAYCHANLEASCEPDFILVHHPLSLNGLLPIPPTCEPDSEKARKVQAVADRAVEELRERNAQYECGELRDDDGKLSKHAEIPEAELKEAVASKRRRGMSQSEFDDLWHSAIGEIAGRDEIVTTSGVPSGQQRLRSTSLANIGLGCALRRSIRVALVRNLWTLVGVMLALASGAYLRWSITSGRRTELRAKHLASMALDQLASQAAWHQQDRDVEPYVSMGQLRDDVLRDEFSAKERQRLWAKVQKKVEANSNIRARVAENRTGEVSRVWEWVGAVHDGSGESGGRRKSGVGRYSLGPVVDSSPPARSSASPEKKSGGDDRTGERRRWDEGRPVY